MMPIDPRLLPVLFVFLFVPVSSVCLYYAVKRDAIARGANGTLWGGSVLFLAPIAGPAYAIHRRRLPDRTDGFTRAERLCGAFGVGGLSAIIVASVVTPPDPYSFVLVALPLLAISVPLALVVCYDVDPRALGSVP